jgi:cell division protein ZipA
MDGLRWLLLLFGVLVVAGVYLLGRRQRQQPESLKTTQSGRHRLEPSLDGEHVDDEPADPDAGTDAEPPVEAEPYSGEQKIVTLRIVARSSGSINGEDLALSLRGIGMRHGKFGIFHRYDGSDEGKVIFSAASLIEPGTFDMATIREMNLPGISLFMVLPGPVDGAESFDLMMTAARALKQSLNAELLDESGSTLSIQRERYLREEIIQFQHSILIAEPAG